MPSAPPPPEPSALYLEHTATVIDWKELRGAYSIWDLIVHDVSKLDGQTLVGLATHWNALIDSFESGFDHDLSLQITVSLGSPEQLEELEQVARRRFRKTHDRTPPPVVNRQQLLILMRLAFQHARWDGRGAPISGPEALGILLRINDHIDGLPKLPPKARRSKRHSIFDRVQALQVMFSLHDFSKRGKVENGVARTLRLMREIHPELRAIGAPQQNLDLLAVFKEATGLSLESYLAMCFAAVALSVPPGKSGSAHLGDLSPIDTGALNIVASSLRGDSALSDQDVERFLGLVARSPEQFKADLESPSQVPFQTNLTVFRTFPIVRFGSGVYRVLDRVFLLDKLGSGAYWILRGALEKKADSRQDRINAVKRINGCWGEVVHEYLHRAFANSAAAAQYRPEPKFDASGDEGGDGLLDHGEDLVLFEYKSPPLAQEPRHSPSTRRLAGEILGKFAARPGSGTGDRRGARGIPQLAATVRAVVSGLSLAGVEPDRVTSIYPVLVCGDNAMSAPMVNCLLRRAFDREMRGADRTKVRPLTVLTIEDVETMLGTGVPFPALLRSWHELDPEMTTSPSVILRGHSSRGTKQNEWVLSAANAWRKEMFAFLWPNGKTAGANQDRKPASP